MNTVLERICAVNWRKWLNLRPEQESAIDAALSLAATSSEIQEALEKDFAHMESGEYALATSAEERSRMYGGPLSQLHPLLTLLGRLDTLIVEYAAREIPDQILIDTLSDVRIWMDVCLKRTGHYGMLEFGWLVNHFTFRLFRIGRLQFIATRYNADKAAVYRHKASGVVMALCPDGMTYLPNGDHSGTNKLPTDGMWTATLREENAKLTGYPIHRRGYALPTPVMLDLNEWERAVATGDTILDMHIAEGCPLDPAEVTKSLTAAPAFFRDYLGMKDIRALTCGSWLLDDNIAQMQPNGNIAAFQKNFYLIPSTNASDRQTRERAFGDPQADILRFECRTSLQRSIKAWYEAGRYCRGSYGIIVL